MRTFPRSMRRPPAGIRRGALWVSWLTGAALVSAVVITAGHFSEERAFVRLAEEIRGRWLLLALVWQAGTYAAQSGIWHTVARASGVRLRPRHAWQLSFAKLFVDQALPSSGIASNLLIRDALIRCGLTRGASTAAASLDIVSYNIAYAIAVTLALVVAILIGQANMYVTVTGAIFILICVAASVGVLALAGNRSAALRRGVFHLRLIRPIVTFMRRADGRLTRDRGLLVRTTALQLAIVACDTATMHTLTQALGAGVDLSHVYVSFMVSSLFRAVGIVPGGLGTFEASSVLTLRAAGVSLPAALSATLLFRGLTFWLPMLPGLAVTRWMASRGWPR